MKRQQVVAVIGAGDDAPAAVCKLAFAVGREIARRGAVLDERRAHGRDGIVRRPVRARKAGIRSESCRATIATAANRHIEFAIATGIGEARNAVIVASADAVIALAGEGGTLAEIGFAKKFGKPIVALDSWPEIEGLNRADTPAEAVALALKLAALELATEKLNG